MNFKKIFAFFGFLLLTILLLQGVFRTDFERWDEQTNIAVVKDTIQSQSIFLKLGDEYFFEKPPIFYYLSILISPITGIELSGRFVSAFSAFGIAILLFKLVNKRYGFQKATVFIYAFLLIPQLYFVNQAGFFSSHTLSSFDLDALQMFFIVLSFYMLFISEKLTKSKIYLSYFFLSLGFLTKGPFVLLPLLINSFYLYKNKLLGVSFKGLVVFMIPIVAWILVMSLKFGGIFIDNFFEYHILNRAINTLEGHSEPLLFYFGIFLDPRMNLLGIPFLLILAKKVRSKFKDKTFQYSLIFLILTLLLFTLVGTKLAWYILPVYPFLALLFAI